MSYTQVEYEPEQLELEQLEPEQLEQEEMPGRFISDSLVLRVACHDFDNIESVSLIYYDDLEREYFVCGSREDERHTYKFYSKKRTTIMNFINSIAGNKTQISIELLNYPNLFVDYDYIDYHVLTSEDTACSTVSCQQDTSFTTRMQIELYRCLKSLKFIRW